MMILEVNRGNIKVAMQGQTMHVPGEMFFAPDEKAGFAIDLANSKHWDFPNKNLELTQNEIDEIIHDIQTDFTKGGHSLVIE